MSLWQPPPPRDDLAGMRLAYPDRPLRGEDLPPAPGAAFEEWLRQASQSGTVEPNAMVLGTAGEDGRPVSRTVLLKGLQDDGFVFYTNYQSRKARHLAARPWASLLFPWYDLHRQVSVVGEVVQLPPEESDAYFASRPRESQVAAWGSQQSQPVASRAELDAGYDRQVARFRSEPLTRPPHWGGYVVRPTLVEFWQGRPSRMHDRLVFESRSGLPASVDDPAAWRLTRWSP